MMETQKTRIAVGRPRCAVPGSAPHERRGAPAPTTRQTLQPRKPRRGSGSARASWRSVSEGRNATLVGTRRHRHPRDGVRRGPRRPHPSSSAPRSRRAAWSSPRTSVTSSSTRWASGAASTASQREHRRLGGPPRRSTRRSRSCSWAVALGRRHGDGPLHRRRPRRASARRSSSSAGADRHRADLLDDHRARSKDLIEKLDIESARHARAPGEAGRRLLHDPRRRAARAPAAHGEPRSSASCRRGGSLLAKWMLAPPQAEPPMYTHFDDICDDHARVRRHVLHSATACAPAASPTPPTRPSSPSSTRSASSPKAPGTQGVQVMVEGPGHVPVRPDRVQHEARAERLPRRAVLRARAARDRHLPRLRPHHELASARRSPATTARRCSATSRRRSTSACRRRTT